jgi:predicted nucleic acid-binding protein
VSFLLDTNVVSEWAKPRPHSGVQAFLATQEEDELFLSVVTLAELRRGVERLSTGRRRTLLDNWLRTDLVDRFAGRMLRIDGATADMWGRLMARRERASKPMGAMDGWIAATAEVHGLVLVTRNTSDFADAVTQMLDPWTDS